MKLKILTAILFSLALTVATVSAQKKTAKKTLPKTPDFTGTWELDTSQSKLDERMRIESMTLTVAQIGQQLKVDSATKRAPRPEGEGQNSGTGRGGGRGIGFGGGGGSQSLTYTLDGKETDFTAPDGIGGGKLKAKFDNSGELELTQSRTLNSPAGEITIKTKENWSLSADGKVLTVKRDMETPRGTNSSTLVFNKK